MEIFIEALKELVSSGNVALPQREEYPSDFRTPVGGVIAGEGVWLLRETTEKEVNRHLERLNRPRSN